jgi:hypothetical protein
MDRDRLGAAIVTRHSVISIARTLAAATGLVVALTLLGVLLGVLAPGLAGRGRPCPVLAGTFGTAAGIFANNLWLLAVPFALCLLDYSADRFSRHIGDLIVFVLVADNALRVGIELGRWRAQLIPYLPQLPLEWAALTIAASVWLTARTGPMTRRRLAVRATATVLLLATAAAVETWATPHLRPVRGIEADTVRGPHTLVGAGGCLRSGFCADPRPIASRSPAPFPSPSSVPLGHRVGADRAHVNPRPPQGGITR